MNFGCLLHFFITIIVALIALSSYDLKQLIDGLCCSLTELVPKINKEKCAYIR